MTNSIDTFLSLLNSLAARISSVRFGSSDRTNKLFNGTAYAQRKKDWFDTTLGAPARAIQPHDFAILKYCLKGSSPSFSSVVTPREWDELDQAYQEYLGAMYALDARRNRATPGRTLFLKAAVERIERLAVSRYGFRGQDLRDRDIFKLIVNAEQDRSINTASLRECVRVAHALCILLEKRPTTIATPALLHGYWMRSAALGLWGCWQLGDSNGSKLLFLKYLKQLHMDHRDPLTGFLLGNEAVFRGDSRNTHFFSAAINLSTNIHEAQSSAIALWPWFKGYLYVDAAEMAMRAGAALDTPCELLEGLSPRSLLSEFLSAGGDAPFLVAAATAVSVKALANIGQYDEAWDALSDARALLDRSPSNVAYAQLRLTESEVALLMCMARSDPANQEKLEDFIIARERASNFADSLNLPLRAATVRRQGKEGRMLDVRKQ